MSLWCLLLQFVRDLVNIIYFSLLLNWSSKVFSKLGWFTSLIFGLNLVNCLNQVTLFITTLQYFQGCILLNSLSLWYRNLIFVKIYLQVLAVYCNFCTLHESLADHLMILLLYNSLGHLLFQELAYFHEVKLEVRREAFEIFVVLVIQQYGHVKVEFSA